jgi:trehalose 6-phosphate synthase/phosphatase
MKALRHRIGRFDANEWVRRFLEHLREPSIRRSYSYASAAELAATLPTADRIVLFLDYDGTLFPIVRLPRLAAPDQGLVDLVARLGALPALDVHVVSGRSSSQLDEWFGRTKVSLHAEHGAESRFADETEWGCAVTRGVGSDWQGFVRAVLEDFTRNTPGSFIEEKAHALAWHYRLCDPLVGERAANELRLHGRETFAPMGLEVVAGKRVLEIRHVGINKGLVVRRVLEQHGRGAERVFAVAIGDDAVDEDRFAAVGEGGWTIAVGDNPSRAALRLRDPAAVRRFLELLEQRMLMEKVGT